MAEIIHFGQSEGIDQKLVKISDNLYQGSRGPAQDDETLVKYRITQILSITSVTLAPIRQACRWTLAIDDGKGWSEEQIDFIRYFCTFIDLKHKIGLIYCDHGASRSSGGIIIWQMQRSGTSREKNI